MSSPVAGRTVICQKWEESERGWGTRPDGYTLHLTDLHRRKFIQAHWDSLPDEVPDEYSRPCGTPYSCEVSEAIYRELQERGGNHWYFDSYPGSGGADGWMQARPTR